MSASTVILDFGASWLAWIGEDLVGSALQIRIFDFTAIDVMRNFSTFTLLLFPRLVNRLIVEQILHVLLVQHGFQLPVSREDHLTGCGWWT